MAELLAEKSQPASPNREQRARASGSVPKSRAVVTAAMLLGTTVGMLWFGADIAEALAEGFRLQLQQRPSIQWSAGDAVHVGQRASYGLLLVAGPLLATAMLLAVSGNLLQNRCLWLPEKIVPDLGRLQPGSSGGHWLSWERWTEGLCSGLVTVLVAFVGITSLWARRGQLLTLAQSSWEGWTSAFGRILLEAFFHIALATIVYAVFDYALAWWRWTRGLRQTDAEKREEQRNLEGDPLIRQRRAQLRS